MFVLEGNSQDPMGSYTYKGLLSSSIPAIDQTILTHPSNGTNYLIYSRYTSSNGQCIYITPLINPYTMPPDGPQHVELSRPSYSWERQGWWVNEGPICLHRNGKALIVYSASGCSTYTYCLGLLVNVDGNYMNAASWQKSTRPIFEYSDSTGVWGPGHNAFTTSPDGKELWNVYHGKASSNNTNSDRSTRIQRFYWNADDTPNLGIPLRTGVTLAAPGEAPGAQPPGLHTEIYGNAGLSGTPYLVTTQMMVEVNFRTGAPAMGAPIDNFSLRWTGRVHAPATGTYGFRTIADDGTRLWIGDTRIIDDWRGHPVTTNEAWIALAGGEHHPLRLEYFDNVASGSVVLEWLTPGSPRWTTVPYEVLSPSTNGVRAQYFSVTNFTGMVRSRIDPVVDFDWTGTIPEPGISSERFSVRWTGVLRAPTTGEYTLQTVSDDGVRLWLDDQLCIDNWTDHASTTDSVTLQLTADRLYRIRMDYYQGVGGSVARLVWTTPEGVTQVIPASALTPPSAPLGSGVGLTAEYFNNMDLVPPAVVTRRDANVDFDWGSGSPDPAVNPDQFSVRWSGQIEPRYSGLYTFHIWSDNGRRLWINGQLVIDGWVDDWNQYYSGSLSLEAGQKVDLVLEYFENNGGACCKLEWESNLQTREIVPMEQLYPPPATVYLTPLGDPNQGQTSFNAAGRWSDGQAPSAANDYVVTNNATLRTPENNLNHTFDGQSLTLKTGGKLWHKGQNNTTVTLADLTVDNGEIRQLYPNAVQSLAGAITVRSGGLNLDAQAANSELRVLAPISGPGAVTLLTTVASSARIVLCATNTYAGVTTVQGNGTLEVQGVVSNAASTADMFVGNDATGPTLVITNGAKLFGDEFAVGVAAGTLTGTVVHAGGEFYGRTLRLARDSAATSGRYQFRDGLIALTSPSDPFFQIGRMGGGVFEQNGGVVVVARNQSGGGNSALLIGQFSSGIGTYTLTGGALCCTNAAPENASAAIGFGGTGTLTVNGATAAASFSGIVRLAVQNTATGTLNLVRGELRVNRLFQGDSSTCGTARFNFGGSSGSAVLRPYDTAAAIGHATGANNLGLTLTGSNAVLRSTDAFGTARTLTIYSVIGESGGSFGITLDGTGTSILQSASTYSGPTVVQSGTLRLPTSSVLPPATELTVVSGATLDLVSGVNTVRTFRVNGELQVRNKLYGTSQFTSGVTGAGTIFAVEGAAPKGIVIWLF
jgi:autotransporter-associated beta strand protein